MKSIVLAEKPSVAAELARVLNCPKKIRGFYEGARYIVTWALGHLVTLAEPEDIKPEYREWKLDYLPMLPDKIGLKVIRKSSHQFRTISSLMKRPDVNEVIIATDAGREGELVARWIMKKAYWQKAFRRLWISSQTDQAIKTGFANLRPGTEYNKLYAAAVCRAEADWLIGLNVTRALTCKFDTQLTAGRVQTPTLAMIIAREEEIKKFKPVDYWTIKAVFADYTGYWQDKNGNRRLFDPARAEAIRSRVTGKIGTIVDVKVDEKQEPPPLAYDLTELQREANRRFGFSAKKTLSLAQSLYERHKLLTYPRTDSRYIPSDIAKTLTERLKAIDTAPYSYLVKPLLQNPPHPGKRFVNDAGVSDHHAIIPTEEPLNSARLDGDERRVYDLVVRRFLAVLYPPYKYTQITVITEAEQERFISRGKKENDPGWRRVEQPAPAEDKPDTDQLPEQVLKLHRKGEQQPVKSVHTEKHQTRPPARYTEGTLLSAMENPGKFIEEAELKDSIKRAGLGTPATRADIIEKIIKTYYVERQGNFLVPTSKGFELIKLVPEELKSPELTARWELRLANIEKGKDQSKIFMEDIKKNTTVLVQSVRNSNAVYKPENVSKTPCPSCGELMFHSKEKGQSVLVCPNRSCGYREGQNQDGSYTYKPGKKGQWKVNQMVKKYSAQGEEKTTLGDLIKAAEEKKRRKP